MTRNSATAILTAAFLTASFAPLAAHRASAQTGQTPPPAQQPAEPQKKPTSQHTEITKTFTVEAVDYDKRLVTLKDSAGKVQTVVAGPKVQKLENLKAGDTVTFSYFESIVYSIRPSSGSTKSAAESNVVRDEGAKPGGAMLQKITTSVTVTAIDPTTPSISVRTDDNTAMDFKIQDKKNLQGIKVGDRVDITYSRALAVSVK